MSAAASTDRREYLVGLMRPVVATERARGFYDVDLIRAIVADLSDRDLTAIADGRLRLNTPENRTDLDLILWNVACDEESSR